jgi:hypothetical protein
MGFSLEVLGAKLSLEVFSTDYAGTMDSTPYPFNRYVAIHRLLGVLEGPKSVHPEFFYETCINNHKSKGIAMKVINDIQDSIAKWVT